MFSNYPGGLDPNNTNNGVNGRYTVAELLANDTERPYPSVEMNNPPGGAINYTTTPPCKSRTGGVTPSPSSRRRLAGANYQNYLIGVQSVVIDSADRLWILDTGRVLTPDGTLVSASQGGAKLVGVNLTTDAVFQTVIFPPTVAYPDSYLNDIRFDLRSNITSSGGGVAYITDSSVEGRNGIIVVDLGTGESWRHLNGDAVVRPEQEFVPFVWGEPLYFIPSPGMPLTFVPFGSDGIAISADGEDLFFGAVGSRYLYSVPTARLRDRSPSSELLAQSAVVNRGQRGVSDGFETDSNGMVYMGNMEQEAVVMYDPANGTISTFVRDPRINWVDTRKCTPPAAGAGPR